MPDHPSHSDATDPLSIPPELALFLTRHFSDTDIAEELDQDLWTAKEAKWTARGGVEITFALNAGLDDSDSDPWAVPYSARDSEPDED